MLKNNWLTKESAKNKGQYQRCYDPKQTRKQNHLLKLPMELWAICMKGVQDEAYVHPQLKALRPCYQDQQLKMYRKRGLNVCGIYTPLVPQSETSFFMQPQSPWLEQGIKGPTGRQKVNLLQPPC